MEIVKSLTTVNFNPNGMKGRLGIVLHSMAGTQNGSIAWFKNPQAQASAHYCIGADGEIVQVVDEAKKDRAWHAGIYDNGKCPSWALPNPNDYCIGIELEDKKDPNWNYPEPQRKALIYLVNLLMERYSIPRDRILLHRNLNPSRRSDPVGQFSFDWLFPVVTLPPTTPIEKIGKDQIIKDIYSALCGGFAEDTIKWRLSTGKNIYEIILDIATNDGNFFEKWIKPRIPEPITPIPDETNEESPLPVPFCSEEDATKKMKEVIASKSGFWNRLVTALSLLP